MTRAEELLSHAARCNRLANVCLDRAVAEKLRQLAEVYWELAGQPAQRFHCIKTCCQSEAPQGLFGFVTFIQTALQKSAVYQKLCSNLTGRPPAEIDVICRTTGMAHGQGTIGSFGACHDRYPSRYRSHAHRSCSKNRLRTWRQTPHLSGPKSLPTKRRRLPET